MIAQKVLIKDEKILEVGPDYKIDQHDFLDNSYVRVFLPKELYMEEARFLKYENGKIVLDKALKRDTLRAEKMQLIRSMRDAALTKLDHDIFKAEDSGGDTSELRSKRQKLRDMTDQFKDSQGNPSSSLDTVNIEDLKL
jgi:hypothetical protein